MPGRQKCSVSEEDTHAVLVRRRMVNTYCRACPRQVAEKHHFLTPNTPIVDELELPSRLLRDSSVSGCGSSGCGSSQAVSQSSEVAGKSARKNTRSGKKRNTHSLCEGSYQKRPKIDAWSQSIGKLDTPVDGHSTIRAVPSCNLDTVSMELTCSTDVDIQTHKKDDGSVHSINDKLQFLKQTISCELHKMSRSSSSTLTITPSQDTHLTSTHHYSHQHTVSQSTTDTTEKKENEKISSERGNLKQAEGSRVASVQIELSGEQEGEERVKEGVGDSGGGQNKGEENSEPSAGNQSVNVSHVSTEPDSVQLVSYNCSSEMEQEEHTTAGQSAARVGRGTMEGDSGNSEDGSGGNDLNRDIGDIGDWGGDSDAVDGDSGASEGDKCDDRGCDGDRCDAGDGDRGTDDDGDGDMGDDGDAAKEESSVSDMEVVRGAGPDEDPMVISPLKAENENTPFVISPGLPKAASRSSVRYSLDLNGLCGLSSTDDSLGREPREKEKLGSCAKKSTSPTNEAAQPGKGGGRKQKVVRRTKTCRKNSSPPQEGTSVPMNTTSARQTTNKTSSSIKRNTRRRKRKRNILSSTSSAPSSSPGACPSSPLSTPSAVTTPGLKITSPAGCLQRAGTSEDRGSSCLEQHFHHLHITPILPRPPSHPHTSTKSQAPLTSTPTQPQDSISVSPVQLVLPKSNKNTRPPKSKYHTLSPPLFTHHHSTEHPLTSTPILPINTHITPNHTHNLVSILEREMEGENARQEHNVMVGHQASTVFDLSLPPTQSPHPVPTTTTGGRSKTILSQVWQRQAGRSGARQPVQCDDDSVGECGPRKTTSGPNRTTHGPKRTTRGPKRGKRGNSKQNCTTSKILASTSRGKAVDHNRKKGAQSLGNQTEQNHATANQDRPSTTTNRPNTNHARKKDSSCLKTNHKRKKLITTTHKSKTNNTTTKRRTRSAPFIKKVRRQYIIPPALRHRPRPRKSVGQMNHTQSRSGEKSFPQNHSIVNFSPKAYPECVLVGQMPCGQRDALVMMSSHITAYSLDNSSVPEDILTQVLTP